VKKLVIIVLFVVVLGAGGAWAYMAYGSAAKPVAAATTTVKVERGPIRLAVASTGRIV